MVELIIDPLEDSEQPLTEAIDTVRAAAIHYGLGILVTRIGAGHFIVRVHPHVPADMIRKR
jgi:hypothetical protein